LVFQVEAIFPDNRTGVWNIEAASERDALRQVLRNARVVYIDTPPGIKGVFRAISARVVNR
jgi:hypothetical protein